MDYVNKKWIRLGNVDFPVHYLITVSEEEAVGLLSSKHIHSTEFVTLGNKPTTLKVLIAKTKEKIVYLH